MLRPEATGRAERFCLARVEMTGARKVLAEEYKTELRFL